MFPLLHFSFIFRTGKDVAEFCVCTFGLENTLLLFSSEIFENSDGQTVSVKAPWEPQCTDGDPQEGPVELCLPGSDHWLTEDPEHIRGPPCSPLTQGYDGMCSDHRGHDHTLDLGEGLGGRGCTAAWGCLGPCGREGRWAYCTAQGEAGPGEAEGRGSYCTAQGEAGPGQWAWDVSRALRGSLLGDAARIDRIRRVVLWSTRAGQSWATSPKVKTYFTCKENRLFSTSTAGETELQTPLRVKGRWPARPLCRQACPRHFRIDGSTEHPTHNPATHKTPPLFFWMTFFSKYFYGHRASCLRFSHTYQSH